MIESAEEFVRLRKSEDPSEYFRAARDSASEAIWFEVIECYPEMRKSVALNKQLPESVHWLLVRDADPMVRSTVADRRQLKPEMLEELAKDPDPSVRARVAWNKRTPKHVLEALAKDQEEFVADAAKRHLNLGFFGVAQP